MKVEWLQERYICFFFYMAVQKTYENHLYFFKNYFQILTILIYRSINCILKKNTMIIETRRHGHKKVEK